MVVGDVVVLELFFYCFFEFVPVCFLVVGVGGFGCADLKENENIRENL